jgi:SAM-dependent methyltransferase
MADDFIYTTDDLLRVLDAVLTDTGRARWDELFADRARPVPFFVDRPDENLAEWLDAGVIPPGRALELGCGPGRNATYLAGRGYRVDAVDISAKAIAWARQRAETAGVEIGFQCCSIFDATIPAGAYDLVYDSGCFHHLPPHRRQHYAELVARALRPGGRFGLACFRPEGGSGRTDQEVYEQGGLGGGLGYSEDRLRELWSRPPFSVRVLRQMTEPDEGQPVFGVSFLWALLAEKKAAD